MSIKLHYGPPGSYKTSGAVFDDLPVAVKEGRVLITNIRGLDNAELVKKTLRAQKKPVDDNFQIIYLDTKKEIEREKFRRFHHWAPQDSYFIVDEINTIFPTEWRSAKLKEYDLHSGSGYELNDKKNHLTDRNGETATGADGNPIIRPQNVTEALEMHRHFNWDFSCTSPSFKKFNSIFHDVAEMCYSHTNRAIIGIKGYWEISHTADNTGKSKRDQIATENKKIPKWVFDLYQSTATGEVRDTTAGTNIFLKPRIILPIIGAIAIIFYGISELKRTGIMGESETEIIQNDSDKTRTSQPNKNTVQIKNKQGISDSISNDINAASYSENADIIPANSNIDHFLQDYKIYISGILWNKKIFSVEFQHETSTLDLESLNELGYSVTFINKCLAKMTHNETSQKRLLMCRPSSNRGSLGQRVNFNPFNNDNRSE